MERDLQLRKSLHSRDLQKVDRLAGASPEHAWLIQCTHALWVDGSTLQHSVLQLKALEKLLVDNIDSSSLPH